MRYPAPTYLKHYDKYKDYIREASKRYNIPEDFLISQIFKESTFRPNVRSSANAYGLMQVKPGTGKYMGFDPEKVKTDPRTNILAGAAYMRYLLDKHKGSFDKPNTVMEALTRYNAGPTGQARMAKRGEPINQYARVVWNDYRGLETYRAQKALEKFLNDPLLTVPKYGQITPSSSSEAIPRAME